jgi:hypothetical protein
MKFLTLSNKEVRLEVVAEKFPVRGREQCKSYGQFMLGRAIQSVYGTLAVLLEEFPIPEERLTIDFYMPHHGLAFEFQGGQHDKFNKFFHGDKSGFENSLARDARKRAWCELNEIKLIEVRSIPSVEELRRLILEARTKNNE